MTRIALACAVMLASLFTITAQADAAGFKHYKPQVVHHKVLRLTAFHRNRRFMALRRYRQRHVIKRHNRHHTPYRYVPRHR